MKLLSSSDLLTAVAGPTTDRSGSCFRPSQACTPVCCPRFRAALARPDSGPPRHRRAGGALRHQAHPQHAFDRRQNEEERPHRPHRVQYFSEFPGTRFRGLAPPTAIGHAMRGCRSCGRWGPPARTGRYRNEPAEQPRRYAVAYKKLPGKGLRAADYWPALGGSSKIRARVPGNGP